MTQPLVPAGSLWGVEGGTDTYFLTLTAGSSARTVCLLYFASVLACSPAGHPVLPSALPPNTASPLLKLVSPPVSSPTCSLITMKPL